MPYAVQPNGRIIVDVKVNDAGPFRFAIDTAATGSFIFEPLRAVLELMPIPDLQAQVHGAVATGSYPVIAVSSLSIGDVTWPDTQLILLPGDTAATSDIDGVLGADFLRRYSLGFFSRDGFLRVYEPDAIADRSYGDWTALAIEPRTFRDSQEPLHYFNVEVAGYSVPALFDLGAGVNMINSAAAEALRLAPIRPTERGEFSGAIGTEPVIAQLSTQTLRTGRISWRNEMFVIADLPIFATLESAAAPLAILGSGLFSQRDFIIDFPRNRLLIRNTAAELR